MARVNAITVVEFSEGVVLGCRSFTNNEEGQKEAIGLFRRLLKENYRDMSDEEVELCIHDKECDKATWQLYMLYSMPV